MRDHITWFWRCLGTVFFLLSFGFSQFHGHGSWLVCEVPIVSYGYHEGPRLTISIFCDWSRSWRYSNFPWHLTSRVWGTKEILMDEEFIWPPTWQQVDNASKFIEYCNTPIIKGCSHTKPRAVAIDQIARFVINYNILPSWWVPELKTFEIPADHRQRRS